MANGKDFNDLQPGQGILLQPGSVVVVGPQGSIIVGIDLDGNQIASFEGCQFIGTDAMTKAHKMLADEVWAREWSDTGESRISEVKDAEGDQDGA